MASFASAFSFLFLIKYRLGLQDGFRLFQSIHKQSRAAAYQIANGMCQPNARRYFHAAADFVYFCRNTIFL